MTSSFNKIITSAGLGAIPVLSLCCFATLSIYAGNSAEFSVSYLELLRAYVPYMSVLIGFLALLGAIMTADGLSRYRSLTSAIAVLIWLQGNILVWDYGALDGRAIDWLSGAWRGVLDLAIWVAVLLVALSAHARIGKALVLAAIATLAIQCVGAATTWSANSDDLWARTDPESDQQGRDAVMRFSSDRNVVHIVMDGFQSDMFADILENPVNGDLKQDLQGFTLFADNLGAYPYTQLTVPALLSGKLYRNHIPVDQFVTDTLQGRTILSAAHDAGFEVDIAAPVGLKNIYGLAKHTYSYGITHSDHVTPSDYINSDSAKLIDLALFRVVPHFAKALIYRDELWVFQARVRTEAYLQMQYFSDLAFLERLSEEMSVERDLPVYKLIHVMLSHRPTVGNERCEYDGKRPTNRDTVTMQARCGLMRVLGILRRMRELGIYDDSLIVLMADHGAWVPVERLQSTGDNEVDVDAMLVAMATPMLAIKPPAATKGFRVSAAPTSVVDLPATVADLLGLATGFDGMPAFSMSSTTPRQRRHMTYGYGINPRSEGYLFPMQEFVVNGSPFDAQAWRQGDRYPPSGAVSAD